MSTKYDALHKSTLVENNNPSTFDERMKLIEAGNTLEENETKKMSDKQFEENFGLSPNTTNTTNTTRNAKGAEEENNQSAEEAQRDAVVQNEVEV